MIVRAMCGTLKQFFIPALGALLLTACTPSDFHKPGPLQKEDVYNSLFPQWVELCAVSQISKSRVMERISLVAPEGTPCFFFMVPALTPHPLTPF